MAVIKTIMAMTLASIQIQLMNISVCDPRDLGAIEPLTNLLHCGSDLDRCFPKRWLLREL